MNVLKCGAYVVFRRHGVHTGDRRCTIHLVDIWRSKADFDTGKPVWHRQDFCHHAVGPMTDPGGALLAGVNSYCIHPNNATLAGDCSGGGASYWSDGPDVYGNLAHPSMQACRRSPNDSFHRLRSKRHTERRRVLSSHRHHGQGRADLVVRGRPGFLFQPELRSDQCQQL